jgi:hypothetical protein
MISIRSVGFACVALAGTVGAQQSPATCNARMTLPEGMRADPPVIRSVCSVTKQPTALLNSHPSDVRFWHGEESSEFWITINQDGSVDRSKSWQGSSRGGGWTARGFDMNVHVLDVLGDWRFTPAMAGDTIVRAIHPVRVVIPPTPDTLPTMAAWRYVSSPKGDTLYLDRSVGRAVAISDTGTASTAVLASIAELRLLDPDAYEYDYLGTPRPWLGCVLVDGGMPAANGFIRRLTARGTPMQGTGRCAETEPWRAVWVQHVNQLSDDEFVVRFRYPRVDHIDGAAFRLMTCLAIRGKEWSARCE